MYLNSPGKITDWQPLTLDFYVNLFDTKLPAQVYAAALRKIRFDLP